MPRTSTTRPKGSGIPAKGAGWGGRAKGAGTKAPVVEVRHLLHDPAILANKEAAAAQMRAVLYDRAINSDNDHAKIAAADKLLDRLEGKPKQVTDVTSGGERIGYVIAAPAEAESVDEWARDHAPK